MKNTKSEIETQTIFYVLMMIIFVWILVFGYNKLNDTTEILSQNEMLKITEEFKSAIEYCEKNPLNKGSVQTFKVSANKFNSICLIGEDINNPAGKFSGHSELKTIYENGDNLVFITATFTKDTSNKLIFDGKRFDIIGTEKGDFSHTETICWPSDEDILTIDIIC